MRTYAAVLLLAGAVACAGRQRNGHRPAVSDDGRAAIVGGESWRAPEGVAFFERRGALHVVSLVPGTVFDVTISLGPDGRPVVPPDAPFVVRDGTVELRDRALPPTARLVESGQLYRHDDHFHLTHHWENPDWKALYRARDEGSPLSPGTRQVAAFALATLLDMRIAGGTEQSTAKAMRRAAETVARARRAVDGQYPAKQIMAMVMHDFEVMEGGRAVTVESKVWRASDAVRFTYCGDHFHVQEAGGTWSHPIALMDAEPGAFELPPSMFFEVFDGVITERSGDLLWKELLLQEQIKLSGDGWYVSEKYDLPAFARLRKASVDPAIPAAVREGARRSVIEFLRVRLDIESDAAFRARLASIERAMVGRWGEVEAQIQAARRRG